MKVAVHIFPQCNSLDIIQEIRRKYDPLSDKIPPHITLVFPFDSITPLDKILSHIQSVADRIPPFTISLKGVTGYGGEYLFLNVIKGNDFIIQLHDELYKGVLSPYRNYHYPYIPHITLGRLGSFEGYQFALDHYKDWEESFQTTVNEIIVEEISEDGRSTVVGKAYLNKRKDVLIPRNCGM
ncbi:2'-5' RNA ligase family protein [Bacillus sp. BHET2]|uniref:2'-5' RNA ligase family protein n=1 Tax=Bacillus sp. BHET2 TaxID=2583818 RepID=UPI00110EA780|nr:2'-5' RNA ligase family protein [Bacillus sp. BHET2]TMU86948.1 2'-5' RNA ligase family protein [Bacillus sp. BHET2]